jgi:L-ascorbate metabolism protein UlaG (beta-lactamase superfamily)
MSFTGAIIGTRVGFDPVLVSNGAEVIEVRSGGIAILVLSLGLIGGSVLADEVTVSFFAHSCFTVQAEGGPVVMIDPYGTYVPYPGLPAPADIVLMTHGHIDHCPDCYGETNRVEGDPIKVFLLNADGRCREKLPPASWKITEEFSTHAIEASHVTSGGGGQGWMCMFSFEIGGVRFAHLGDLGKTLTPGQIAALSDVDVLFIPVGGAFTINASEAMTVIAQLPSVKVVFPIHHFVAGHTPSSWSAMAPVSGFVLLAQSTYTVREIDDYQAAVSADTLPRSTEVWILEYKKE